MELDLHVAKDSLNMELDLHVAKDSSIQYIDSMLDQLWKEVISCILNWAEL